MGVCRAGGGRFCDRRVPPSTQNLQRSRSAGAEIPWICAQIAAWPLWRALRDVWGMGRRSPGYTPKAPAQGVLHQVVRDHFETFRAEAARVYERDALPRFIEEESRGFLRCGFLAGGFASGS